MDRLEGRGSSSRGRSIIEDAAVTQVLLRDRHRRFLLARLLHGRLYGLLHLLLHLLLHGLSGRLNGTSDGPNPRRPLFVDLAFQDLDGVVKDLIEMVFVS